MAVRVGCRHLCVVHCMATAWLHSWRTSGQFQAFLMLPPPPLPCRYYGREIAAFDIQTKRVDVYGQDAGYTERAMVIYDGLHYDALAVAASLGAGEALDVTVLPSRGPRCEAAMAGAAQLVAEAHAARQFTGEERVASLRCVLLQVGVFASVGRVTSWIQSMPAVPGALAPPTAVSWAGPPCRTCATNPRHTCTSRSPRQHHCDHPPGTHSV